MSLDQAKQYLARVLPWPQEGDAPAFVNVHWTFKPTNIEPGRKLPWTGRAVRSVNDAVRAVEWARNSPTAFDIYVCLSTQRDAEERTSAKGYKWMAPLRSAENAVCIKTLFLDIDVKPHDTSKGYATAGEAVTSLGNFCQQTGLPRPTIVVASGGGLHVYWVLARALTPSEWRPLAFALANATRVVGLKCDTECTIDVARVLRVPDTFNMKTEPARPVRIAGKVLDFDYINERIETPLRPYMVALPPEVSQAFLENPDLFPKQYGVVVPNDLGAGIARGMPREEIRACLDAIPNTKVDWNFWNTIGMRVWAACDGDDIGFDEWQRWSDKNAIQLPKDSCRERWETFSTSPPTRTGPGALVLAAREALANPTWVPTPPPPPATQQTIQGPTPLGQVNGAAALLNDLPKGFFREANGIIVENVMNEDGSTQKSPLINYPIQDPMLQEDPSILHFTTVTRKGKVRKIEMPTEICASKDAFLKFCHTKGIMVPDFSVKRLREFFVAWIERLQQTKDMVVSSAPFGWSENNGKIEGFVFGGFVWTPNGERRSANPDPIIGSHYTPKGDIELWKQAAKITTEQERPDLDAIIAASFAAPLVRFTGQLGLLMSTYSIESGLGKTTALRTAQAMWGDPIRAAQGLTDTPNSVMRKITEIQSLPLFWDELKTEDETKKFVNLVFQMSAGREKSRLRSDSSMRELGMFQTLLICASNDSLIDYVVSRTKSSPAGFYRVFEYEVAPPTAPSRYTPGEVDRITAKLNSNYGHVGLEYAQWLGKNFVMVEQQVANYRLKVDQDYNIRNDERFWSALVAAICCGAYYGNLLGFTSINEEKLFRFMIEKLEVMRRTRKTTEADLKDTMNVSNVLGQYLNAMRSRHTLFTNRIWTQIGKPPSGHIQIKRGDPSKLDGVYVHVGLEDNLMRINSTHFSAWLTEHGYSRHLFTKALESDLGVKHIRGGRLGSGTDYVSMTKEYLLEVNFGGSNLLDFINES